MALLRSAVRIFPGLFRGGSVLLLERRGENRVDKSATQRSVVTLSRSSMGFETVDAFSQHMQLQQHVQVRSAAFKEIEVVEVALESAPLPVPGSRHSSVHSLDGEYTRCWNERR